MEAALGWEKKSRISEIVVGRRDVSITVSQYGSMAIWQYGSMAAWQYGQSGKPWEKFVQWNLVEFVRGMNN